MHCALCLSLASVNVYIIKVFRGRDVDILDAQLKLLFRNVVCAKPRSSRNSSIESFMVCRNFEPPKGFREIKLDQTAPGVPSGCRELDKVIKFVACGDLSGYDSDKTYPLEADKHNHKDPVQKPIHPPYDSAIALKKQSAKDTPSTVNTEHVIEASFHLT